MKAEIERQYAEFKAISVTDSKSAQEAAMAAMTMAAGGTERISDVHLMLQLFFCRHVDNFQTFLEDTIRAIYSSKPELLRRSEQVTVAQVLAHAEMRSFIEELIETRIHKLAYKSVRDLAIFLKEDAKFELFPETKPRMSVELSFDVRNLITHNYGIVNRIFLSKHPDAGLSLGQAYPVFPERIAESVRVLIAAARDVETRAVQKFRIVFPIDRAE